MLKSFDWISPLWAILQDLTRGPAHTFLIDQTTGAGQTGREIENLLRRAGCQTWGAMWIGQTLTVSVPKTQAWPAWLALARAGVTCPEPARAKRTGKSQRARPGRRSGRARGLWARLGAWLDQ